jgi:DNA-directed RNA polymerase specialized sigma24 family protein
MTKLTELVVGYQETGTGYETVRREVEQWVYYYPASRPGFSQEDCADFLLYFRGKVPALVYKYTHYGRSFEHYLARTLRWQLRSFARVRRRRVRMHELTRAPDIWDGLIGVAESSDSASRVAETATRRLAGARRAGAPQGSASRRMVILAMKAAVLVSDAQLGELARVTGYSEEWLRECRDELKLRVGRRDGRRAELRERRNNAFFQVRLAQDELAMTPEKHRRAAIHRELERQTRRLLNARRELARVPAVPSNGEISAVLGIPKGTIDSALHYMKRRLRTWQSRDTQ